MELEEDASKMRLEVKGALVGDGARADAASAR